MDNKNKDLYFFRMLQFLKLPYEIVLLQSKQNYSWISS